MTQKNFSFRLGGASLDALERLQERDDLSTPSEAVRWALARGLEAHERERDAELAKAVSTVERLEAAVDEMPTGERTWHRAEDGAYIIRIGDHRFRLDESTGQWRVALPLPDGLVRFGTVEDGGIKWLGRALNTGVLPGPRAEVNWEAIHPADD